MAKNLFNSIKLTRPKNNVFDLTHDVKLSCNMGELVPIMVQECVPGDKFNIGAESIIRFAPMVAPVMHRMDVSIHYFFVPNRITWENWEKFITNTKLQTTGMLPAFPFLPYDSTQDAKRLPNYLGVPKWSDNTDASTIENISALPFAAYQAIWSEFYRDQNLYPEIDWKLVDGENDWDKLGILRKRAWEHDYYTSSLPFAQKGDSVDIPLGKVGLNGDAIPNAGKWLAAADQTTPLTGAVVGAVGTAGVGVYNTGPYTNAVYDPNETLEVEPTSINDLRRAFKLQEWLERNARGGTRYIENILAHFGVRSSDKRLQRPEYIVGTKSPVIISEILNTTGTTELPQGNMSGHGVSFNQGKFGGYYCEEHGYIIGVMSVMPKTAYFQGMPKHFLKIDDPTQYYWPSFAHLGEQEVKIKEVYAYADNGEDPFGYVPRYAEYKFTPNRVAGDMTSNLDFWHLARKFDTVPALNSDFVECNPDTRIFAVEDPNVQKLFCQVLNKVKAIRPMPKYGTPMF